MGVGFFSENLFLMELSSVNLESFDMGKQFFSLPL